MSSGETNTTLNEKPYDSSSISRVETVSTTESSKPYSSHDINRAMSFGLKHMNTNLIHRAVLALHQLKETQKNEYISKTTVADALGIVRDIREYLQIGSTEMQPKALSVDILNFLANMVEV